MGAGNSIVTGRLADANRDARRRTGARPGRIAAPVRDFPR